jgi:redox-regulated HSP33 family molecular chaperone
VGAGAEGLLRRIVGEVCYAPLDRIAPSFHFPCGPRRVLRAVALLGRDVLREIVEEEQILEVRCAFCETLHRVAPADLAPLLSDA